MVFGLEGEYEDKEGNRISLKGRFPYVPKGVKHDATKFTKESVLLFFWDGPPI